MQPRLAVLLAKGHARKLGRLQVLVAPGLLVLQVGLDELEMVGNLEGCVTAGRPMQYGHPSNFAFECASVHRHSTPSPSCGWQSFCFPRAAPARLLGILERDVSATRVRSYTTCCSDASLQGRCCPLVRHLVLDDRLEALQHPRIHELLELMLLLHAVRELKLRRLALLALLERPGVVYVEILELADAVARAKS